MLSAISDLELHNKKTTSATFDTGLHIDIEEEDGCYTAVLSVWKKVEKITYYFDYPDYTTDTSEGEIVEYVLDECKRTLDKPFIGTSAIHSLYVDYLAIIVKGERCLFELSEIANKILY